MTTTSRVQPRTATSTSTFTTVTKQLAVAPIAYIPPAVVSLNMPSIQAVGKTSAPAAPNTGMAYTNPAKLSAIAQQASQMMQIHPSISMPSAGLGKSSSGGPAAGNTGISQAAVAAAAAATAASGGGGGGGSEPQQQDDTPSQQPDQSYDDQGPQYDESGAYSDPTWDAATTPAPAPIAAIVAPNVLPPSTASAPVSASMTSKASIVPPSPATPAVPAKSIWQRFLSLLGFGATESPQPAPPKQLAAPAAAAVHGDTDTVEGIAGSLVRRSRLGDQNATAMLCEIRDNAKRGNAKAIRSQKLILAYIDANPVRDDVDVGEELRITIQHDDLTTVIEHGCGTCDPTLATAVSLSLGPPLTNTSISKYMTRFGADMQRAMVHGMLNPRTVPHPALKEHLRNAHEVGRTIGAARRLQAVRGGAPFSALDPVIGWEMGE